MDNEKRIVVQLKDYCSTDGYKWQVLDNDGSIIEEGTSSSTAKAFMEAYCFCDGIDLVQGGY